MPDYTNLLDKHFKAANLKKPLTLTLREVVRQEVGQDKQVLPVAMFNEDPRGLVLNTGRYNKLAEAHDDCNTDVWTGAVITIETDPDIKFKGKKVGGVVVSKVQPAPKK